MKEKEHLKVDLFVLDTKPEQFKHTLALVQSLVEFCLQDYQLIQGFQQNLTTSTF